MLTVVVLLGEVVLRRMSEGAWIVFAAIAVIAIVVARRHLRKAWARGG